MLSQRTYLPIFFLLSLCIPYNSAAQVDSVTNLLNKTPEEKKFELYLLLSDHYKDIDSDSSLYYINLAIEITLIEEVPRNSARAYFHLGKTQMRRDSIIPARDNFYKSLNYIEKCDCLILEAEVLMYLGKSYTVQDNYYEAIGYLMQSLQIAEEYNQIKVLSDLYDDIGLLLLVLENYDQSMFYFNKALQINEELKESRNYATTLRDIGFIHTELNNFEKAESSFEKAFYIYRELEDDWGMATAKMGEGNVEFKMEQYDSALILYKQAAEIAEKIDIRYKESGPLIQAYCYNHLGKTYIAIEDYKNAIKNLRKSADLAEEFTMPGRKADASKLFSIIYENLGNMSLALDYYQTYDKLSDSIINAKNVSKITKLELEYQYLKKQKEQEIEQIKTEAEYNRKVLIYEMLFLLSALVIAGLFFILMLYRKNQKSKAKRAELTRKNLELEKRTLQNELEFKNKELATSVMYQLKKNNFISTISKKIKEINIGLGPKYKKSLLAVVRELEANMSKESWEEFEYRFNTVHNDFYDKLIKDFPDLTPNELKLCAFLKLNMTSKDISTITYTSPQSITVARHRLRSKLGLQRDDNLITFLSKY